MRLQKAIQVEYALRAQILSAFSWAEKYSLTHEAMLDLLKERVKVPPKSPRWLQSNVSAMIGVLFAQLYVWPNPKVVWRHFHEGKQYNSWDDLPEAAKELARQDKLESGHVWKDSGKPFSIGKTTATPISKGAM